MNLRTVLPVALALSALPLGALAQSGKAPAPSTWKLNLHASDFGGTPKPTSTTTRLLANSDTSLHWRQTITDSHGTVTHSWSGAPDGKLRPILGGKGEKFSMTKDGTFHVDESDGSTIDGTILTAEDAKSYTETATLRTKDGQEQRLKLIYDRVK